MNSLDFGIILGLFLFLALYKRRSTAFYVIASGAACIGYLLGVVLAPLSVRSATSDLSKGIFSIFLISILAVAACLLGIYIGDKVRMSIISSRYFRIDKLLVIPMKILLFVVGVILLAQTLVYIPILSLQYLAQGSSIIYLTNTFVPETFIAHITSTIAPLQFRDLHLKYDDTPLTYNNIQNSGDFQSVINTVAPSVVRISGRTCDGLGHGSGFVVGDHLIATNAHVINGVSTIYISDHQGSYPATPLIIDFDHDIAIIYSRYITDTSLPVMRSKASVGTQAVVVGYPLGGDLRENSGPITHTPSSFQTIAHKKLLPSDIISLKLSVEPGNSGSPILDHTGSVIGIISAGAGDTAIGVSPEYVQKDIVKAQHRLIPSRTDICGSNGRYF